MATAPVASGRRCRCNGRLLEAITEFIEDHQPDETEPLKDNEASRVMYRGRPVNLDSEKSANTDTKGSETDTSDSDHTVTYGGKPVDDS